MRHTKAVLHFLRSREIIPTSGPDCSPNNLHASLLVHFCGWNKFFFAIPRTSQAQRKKEYVVVYGDKTDGTRVVV